MKKLLYGLLVLFVAGVAIANPGNLGVFQTKNWIGFPVYSLDTLTGQWRRPDSVYLHIFYGRLANLPSFTTRVASDFVAASWLDSMKISSATNPIYTFHDSVGRIDADSGNGAYWGLLQTFFQTKTTDFSFEFTISDSSFTKAINKAAGDSAYVDGSVLAGLTGAISATTIATDAIGAAEIAADAIGASELATDAITATEIAADAIGASEVAANAIGASEVATGAIVMGAEIDTTGLAASVWAHGTKILTALDEDNTVMDLNATTIGTAINVTTLNGIAADVITASSIATDAIGAAELAADAIGSSELAATAVAEAADGVWDEALSGHGTAGTAGEFLDGILDTVRAHAPHANNWGGTAAGSGSVTPDTIRDIIGDSLATFLTPRQLRDTIWTATGARILTELDEDNTTIDINGTTIGTATNVTTLNGIAANVITATSIATDAIGAAEIADAAIDSATFASSAKTGLAHYVWGSATRTLTSGGGTADVYPLTGIKFVVDAVGADGNSQFVSDTVSIGAFSSNQAALVNRALIIRSLGGGLVQIPTTITRVAYNGANCSLTVSIDAPKNFAANDTLQLTGLPWHDFATLGEAAAAQRDTILETPNTGYSGDATIGGEIVDGGGSDTTAIKVMMSNNQVLDAADTTLKLGQSSTGAGVPRRGEVASLSNMADTIRDIVDGISGGGAYAGSGAYACTLYVFDGATAVDLAVVNVYNSDESARNEKGNTDPNGRVIFNLDAATYKIRVRYGGATQNTNPQSVVVTSAGANDTIQINIVDPTLCSVSGTLRYRDGEPIAGAFVYAFFESALDTIGYDGAEYIGDIQPVRTNANGDWAISLTPNVLLDANSKYIIRYVKQGVAGLPKERKIVVPNQGTADISDL